MPSPLGGGVRRWAILGVLGAEFSTNDRDCVDDSTKVHETIQKFSKVYMRRYT